jgi:hypothetical protein
MHRTIRPNYGEMSMEANELHRGRLLDHLPQVVKDLAASRRFYAGVMEVLGIPLGGEGEGYFCTTN